MPAQPYLLETLDIKPVAEDETGGPVRRSQDERWNTNLAAARQFHTREGHLRPSRKHVEMINVDGGAEVKQEAVMLGAWLDNTRKRAAKSSAEHRAQLAGLVCSGRCRRAARDVSADDDVAGLRSGGRAKG